MRFTVAFPFFHTIVFVCETTISSETSCSEVIALFHRDCSGYLRTIANAQTFSWVGKLEKLNVSRKQANVFLRFKGKTKVLHCTNITLCYSLSKAGDTVYLLFDPTFTQTMWYWITPLGGRHEEEVFRAYSLKKLLISCQLHILTGNETS